MLDLKGTFHIFLSPNLAKSYMDDPLQLHNTIEKTQTLLISKVTSKLISHKVDYLSAVTCWELN
jgi:hypothetical protein